MLKLNHLTGFGSGAAAAVAAADVTSYVLDGTGDYLSIPDHADWDYGAGDWTIEFFKYETTVTNDVVHYSQYKDAANRVHINNKGGGNRGISIRIEIADVVTSFNSNNSVLSDATWHHVALVHDSSNNYVYIDGVDQTMSDTHGSSSWADFSVQLTIGENNGASYFNGNLDEYRISNVARYPSGTTFTPTSTQFVSDANTLLLIHGGEAIASGTTGSGATFVDSGNTGHTVTENGNAIRDISIYKF